MATSKSSKSSAASEPATDEQPRDIGTAATGPELPTLGEKDGRFYVFKHLDGEGDIPDKVHHDNIEEVKVIATNNGWRPNLDGNDMVDHAAKTDAGWDVTYSIAVTPLDARPAE